MSDIMLSLPVGATVSSSIFLERVRRAILSAKTGRSRWVDMEDVRANFTTEAGTNLQVVGLGDTTEVMPFRLTFLDWGDAPQVEAPPAPEVEDELEYFLRNGPAVDAAR